MFLRLSITVFCLSGVATGAEWLPLEMKEFSPTNGSFSPDGKMVVLGGTTDSGVKVQLAGVFNVSTGKLLREIEFATRNDSNNKTTVRYSNSSNLILISNRLYNYDQQEWVNVSEPVISAHKFSKTNQYYSVISSSSLVGTRIFDTETQQLVAGGQGGESLPHRHAFVGDKHLLRWLYRESQLDLWSIKPWKKLNAIGTARYKLVNWQVLPGEKEVALLYQSEEDSYLKAYDIFSGQELRSATYPRDGMTYGNTGYRNKRLWFTNDGRYLLSVRHSNELRGMESALVRLGDLQLVHQPFRVNKDLKKDVNSMRQKLTLSIVKSSAGLLINADEVEHSRARGSFQPSGAAITLLDPFGEKRSFTVVQKRMLNFRFRPTDIVCGPKGENVVVFGKRQRWTLKPGGNRLNHRDYDNESDGAAYLVKF